MGNPTLLEHPPVYCSACWQQKPDQQHIDYHADNDQGYGDPESTDTRIAYDNLQLCEDCTKLGARLYGMVDGDERGQELRDAEVKIDRLERELRQARTFADNLESAFDTRPEHGPIKIDHRRKPRQIKEPSNG